METVRIRGGGGFTTDTKKKARGVRNVHGVPFWKKEISDRRGSWRLRGVKQSSGLPREKERTGAEPIQTRKRA